MTDRWNAAAPGGGTDAGTGQSVSLARSFPCAPTASTSTGSTCTLNTSANAIVPGLVKDTKRAIWQMDQVQVYDGGPDGDADTPRRHAVRGPGHLRPIRCGPCRAC